MHRPTARIDHQISTGDRWLLTRGQDHGEKHR
jgi:hypothetical protein